MSIEAWSDNELNENIKRLRYLCDHLDPYGEINERFKNELTFFQITSYRDPFELTNKLLKLMEDTLEEKEKRKLH